MNKLINRKFLITLSLLILVSVIIASCGNRRDTVNPERLEHKSDRELENALMDQNKIPFEWFSVRIGVDIQSEKQNGSFSAYVKLKVDSVMGGSIKVGPVLWATYKITKDSIFFAKKMDKCYFAESLDYVSTLFGTTLEFGFLQSLILGLPVGLEEDAKYEQIKDKEDYILSSHKRRDFVKLEQNKLDAEEDEMFIQYHLNSVLELSEIQIQIPADTMSISINYSERKLEDGFMVPEETTIVFRNPSDTITIHLNYATVKLNEPTEIDINIPESYIECP